MLTVSPEQYAGEVSAFKTQTGNLRVGIEIDALGGMGSLKVDLHAQQASFGMPGVHRERLRNTLLGRIERGLEKYRDRAQKIPGNLNPFQVFVILRDVSLTNSGLVEASSFIREMINILGTC